MRERPDSETHDLDLSRGGPFYQLQRRLHLVRQDSLLIGRRIVLAWAVTWLPLLILSAVQGNALGDTVRMPFLLDYTTYSRFLVAVAILISADAEIGRWTGRTMHGLLTLGFVEDRDIPKANRAAENAVRLRDSVVAEVIIIAVAYLGAWVALNRWLTSGISSWYVVSSISGRTPTLAGWWCTLVSVPVYLFLLTRWLYRFGVWSWFLRQMAKVKLRLEPTHPDEAGGIGFITVGQNPFALIVFTLGLVVAAAIAVRTTYEGAPLATSDSLVVAYLVLALVVFLGPLLVFSPMLAETRRLGMVEYTALATDYTCQFERKWLRGERSKDEVLLGSQDIQALADIGGSFERVRQMRVVLFDSRTIGIFALAAVIPMLPLTLINIPVDQILNRLLKIVI